jgi:RimJ/RimL family protein N-acetyltransferase
LFELAEEARLGVHEPGVMPFSTPWTDASPEERGLATLQWHWGRRAALTAQRWSLNFLVRHKGRVVGIQGLDATEFALTRDVATGSWLGLRHQGRGIGTEMRAAVLIFAFEHLGATQARSGAFLDNPASLRVSEKLGYRRDGIDLCARRGERAENARLLLTPDTFVRPAWTLQVEGAEPCLATLGAGHR